MQLFVPLLLLLFIAFKLAHVIAWSWLWVLSPLWIPISLGLLLYAPWWVYTTWFETEEQKNTRKLIDALGAYSKLLGRR